MNGVFVWGISMPGCMRVWAVSQRFYAKGIAAKREDFFTESGKG